MINLKYQLLYGMITANYLIDHVLYQIFKFIFKISLKTWRRDYYPSIRIYVNKTENSITFKI